MSISSSQGGWTATDTPAARSSFVEKARVASVLLCLHLVAFQIIAGFVVAADFDAFIDLSGVHIGIGVLFLLVALFYVALALALGLDLPHGEVLGLVLCIAAVFLWAIVLVSTSGMASLPRSGWFLVLSILDALGLMLGLVVLRQPGLAPAAPAAG